MDNFPTQSRSILNANRGISNVIESKVINTDLQRVAGNLFDILLHHYGPYSGFAAVDDNQPLNETTFTKDGIGIIRSVEYASPQEEWVRKTIAYIGSRMENTVGDGTTSAMMFTCAMLKHASEHIDEIRPMSYTKFRRVFDELVKRIERRIKQAYTYSAFKDPEKKEVDKDAVYAIVANQVYTSSHGDYALAKALADLYKNTPPELWERMTYERCRYETDKTYEITKTGGQYEMRADVMASSMLNKDLCTWYEKDHVTLVVLNDALCYDSPDWEGIMQLIDECPPSKSVAIVCHTIMDTNSYQLINEKINKCNKAGRPFAVFTTKPENPKINDFVALQAIVGVDVTKYGNGEALQIEDVHLTYKHKKLTFDNIVEVPEEYVGKNERHQVTDGKHSQFTEILEEWERQAKQFDKCGVDDMERGWANYFNRMYVKLRYNKIYTVTIGGKAYDNVAFKDVLDDAIKAASRALSNGATFSNNRALYLAINDIMGERGCTPTMKWFSLRIKESLEDISKVVLKRLYPHRWFTPFDKKDFVNWWFSHVVDLLQYDIHPYGSKWFRPWRHQLVHFRMPSLANVKDIFRSGCFCICQPMNADITMLERFGEVALKFILTERVVIKGGAYVDKRAKR